MTSVLRHLSNGKPNADAHAGTRYEFRSVQVLTTGLGDESAACAMEGTLCDHGALGWSAVGVACYRSAEGLGDVLFVLLQRAIEPEPAKGE